jgi:hypothetical protein
MFQILQNNHRKTGGFPFLVGLLINPQHKETHEKRNHY